MKGCDREDPGTGICDEAWPLGGFISKAEMFEGRVWVSYKPISSSENR